MLAGPGFLGAVAVMAYVILAAMFVRSLHRFGATLRDQLDRRAGAWTDTELRQLDPRRWQVIDDVVFADEHVEHVVLGPSRIYAVVSRTTSRVRASDGWARRVAADAERGASRVQALLRAAGLEREVIPLVVVWGPARGSTKRASRIVGRARFVDGSADPEWLDRLPGGPGEAAAADLDAFDAVKTFMSRREEYEAGRNERRAGINPSEDITIGAI